MGKTMKKIIFFTLFLFLNFSALAIGSWLMGLGPRADWYLNLNKAPWTPPGWVFGVAWTFIMICFSLYMVVLLRKITSPKVWFLFAIQWVLNVSWNWFFFNQHFMIAAELVLFLLTLTVLGFAIIYRKNGGKFTVLIIPYFLWLLVANSMNIYAVLYN